MLNTEAKVDNLAYEYDELVRRITQLEAEIDEIWERFDVLTEILHTQKSLNRAFNEFMDRINRLEHGKISDMIERHFREPQKNTEDDLAKPENISKKKPRNGMN